MNSIDLATLREETVFDIRKLLEKADVNGDESECCDAIYARIYQVEFKDKKFQLSGDLFTKKLINFDALCFSEEYGGEGIKPIIFGFETAISLESVWHRANPLTSLMFYCLRRWFDFSDYHRIAYELDNLPMGLCMHLLDSSELSNMVFSIRFDKSNYNANIYLAASPFKIYKKRIMFVKAVEEISFKRATNCFSRIKRLAETDIPVTLSDFVPSVVREFNVGQGNFSELIDHRDRKLVFDPGMTFLDDHNNFANAVNELKSLDAESYFVSHFDLDHILGAIYLQDSQFGKDKLWIIPKPDNINVASVSADRLIWFLYHNAKIRMLDDNTHQNEFVFNHYINIYKGTCVKPYGNSRNAYYANNSGIMIAARGNEKRALLPGDCLYGCWSSKVCHPSSMIYPNHEVDYLIVPHHGCKWYDKIRIKGSVNAVAIVPVGKRQRNYHHPDYMHLSNLEANGFKNIYLTTDLRNSLNLSNAKLVNGSTGIDLSRYPDVSPKNDIELPL